MSYFGTNSPAVIVYPAIPPNYLRELTLPDFGLRVFENEDSSETRRITHQTGHNTKLRFVYEGRTAAELAVFINFYNHCRGSYHVFSLPSSIIQHPSPYLTSLAALGDVGYWRFMNPLQIETVVVNVYSFTVDIMSLGASLTVPSSSDAAATPFVYSL